MSTTTVEINGEEMTLVETINGLDRYEDEHGDDHYFNEGDTSYEVDVYYCDDCSEVVPMDETRTVAGGTIICEPCEHNYEECSHCEELHLTVDLMWTLNDDKICDHCRDWNYSYCEHCDGYYHHDWEEDHYHDGCDCEAPAQTFKVRNGDTTLANDERLAVSLPSGVISDEGIGQIANLLRMVPNTLGLTFEAADLEQRRAWSNLSYTLADLDTAWQTKEGNFTKRLSRHAYKDYGLKVPAEVLTQVGNIASQHSQGSDLDIEITRNLNLPAEEFAHEDSCWWQSYSSSRCALKNHGGFGLRSFGEHKTYWGEVRQGVKGRAWVMPMRLDAAGRLVPTFDGIGADAFIVFNGYGDLSGYAPARIMAQMSGMTYKKIDFSCDPMYVNAGGYLVASEEIVKTTTEVHLTVDEHDNLYYREQEAARRSALVNA